MVLPTNRGARQAGPQLDTETHKKIAQDIEVDLLAEQFKMIEEFDHLMSRGPTFVERLLA